MNNTTKIALFCAAALALFAINSWYQKSGVLTHAHTVLLVGTNANFPPFEALVDGNFEGFEIDLMQEIGKLLGKEIVFKDMAFEALLMEAQSGRINVVAAALTPTAERSNQLFFTTPYVANDPLVIITLADNKLQSLDDLKGKEVIVNDGYTAESFMAQQEGITLRRIASPAEAFLALTQGRCPAYVSAQSAVQPYFQKNGRSTFNVLPLAVADSYALALPKAFPELFEQIEQALVTLKNNGVLERLKIKWSLNF